MRLAIKRILPVGIVEILTVLAYTVDAIIVHATL